MPDTLPVEESSSPQLDAAQRGGSRLISRLLPPAIRFWLQAQLDHIEGLSFRINGKDRQILSGYIPEVGLSAQRAVYQGLHVSQVEIAATEIQINLGQVVRGKPLRLLQPFPVSGQVSLGESDLRNSLMSPLLAQGLGDVLSQLKLAELDLSSGAQSIADLGLDAYLTQIADLELAPNQLTLIWASPSPEHAPLRLQTGLIIEAGRWLHLDQPSVRLGDSAPMALENVTFDLGPEVDIKRLTVIATMIQLEGVVRVIPAD